MEHVKYQCSCNGETHCMFCDGDLFQCTVCGGAEGSLPTQCPGEQMSEQESDAVYAGYVDFINGKWVPKERS